MLARIYFRPTDLRMTDKNEVQGGDENRLIAERRAKLAAVREQGAAFPNDFRRDSLADDLQRELADKDKPELEQLDRKAAVAGRIMARRGPFMVLQDSSSRIQLYVDKKALNAELLDQIKGWDIGDIVGAEGPVHKSGKGICGIYTKDIAETKVALVNQYSADCEHPLMCEMQAVD